MKNSFTFNARITNERRAPEDEEIIEENNQNKIDF